MVFGWKIERPHPSFEAPGLIGLWVQDRPPAAMAGPLIWISVDHIDASLELSPPTVVRVLEPSTGAAGWSTIRDPPAAAPCRLRPHRIRFCTEPAWSAPRSCCAGPRHRAPSQLYEQHPELADSQTGQA